MQELWWMKRCALAGIRLLHQTALLITGSFMATLTEKKIKRLKNVLDETVVTVLNLAPG